MTIQDSNLTIKVIASGSAGNCYYLHDGSTALLLECGIKFKDIQKALDFNLSDIQGVLVTHEHGDHSKAVKDILKRGMPVYMSEGTWTKLDIRNYSIFALSNSNVQSIGSWSIYPFNIQHDAAEPLGFVLTSDNGYRVLFVTDTYIIPYAFTGVTHMLIECNYDHESLQESIRGGLQEFRYKRILRSHNSLESVLDYLNKVDKSKLQEIHLIHLSEGNANPHLMLDSVYDLTKIKTFTHGGGIQ